MPLGQRVDLLEFVCQLRPCWGGVGPGILLLLLEILGPAAFLPRLLVGFEFGLQLEGAFFLSDAALRFGIGLFEFICEFSFGRSPFLFFFEILRPAGFFAGAIVGLKLALQIEGALLFAQAAVEILVVRLLALGLLAQMARPQVGQFPAPVLLKFLDVVGALLCLVRLQYLALLLALCLLLGLFIFVAHDAIERGAPEWFRLGVELFLGGVPRLLRL